MLLLLIRWSSAPVFPGHFELTVSLGSHLSGDVFRPEPLLETPESNMLSTLLVLLTQDDDRAPHTSWSVLLSSDMDRLFSSLLWFTFKG